MRGGKFLIVDCKNTNNAHPEAFRHAALFRYAYHVQAAHYFQGFSEVMPGQIAGFAFIAYERTPPYKASFMFADPTFLVAGRRQAAVYFATYLRCRGADYWPCYPDHYELRAGEKHRIWEPAGYSPDDEEEPF